MKLHIELPREYKRKVEDVQKQLYQLFSRAQTFIYSANKVSANCSTKQTFKIWIGSKALVSALVYSGANLCSLGANIQGAASSPS